MTLPADLGGATLRRYTMDDLADLWAVVDAERDRLGEWMPWVEGTRTVDDQRRWLSSVVDKPEGFDGLGVFVEGDLAGGVGMAWDGPWGIAGEIGYWIAAAYEGRGLVTRAAQALTSIGFDTVGLNRMVIRAGVANPRSRAVAERLGYRLEGVARGDGKGIGGFYDTAVYGMTADDWRERQGAGA